MSRGARIGLVVVALLVLAGGAVLAASGGSDDGSQEAGTAPTTTAPAPSDTQAQTTPAQTAPAEPAPRVERIRLRDHGPAGDVGTLEYDKGETVRLRVTSNVADELHIHGYDKYVKVVPGKTAVSRFEADIEGAFEIESHTSNELVARLEVKP